MFTELMPLLRKRRLLLTVSLVEADTIRATVVPQKASDTEDNALTTPLAITGTAEELDRDLPQQLVEFAGAHLQLQTHPSLCQSRNGCSGKGGSRRGTEEDFQATQRDESNNASGTSGSTRPSGTRGAFAVCATGTAGNDSRTRGGGGV